MDSRVIVVDQVGSADAVVSVKLTPSGGPVKLLQGWRTATNAGLPFIVVGRKLNPESLKKTLGPLADAKRRGEKLGASRSNFDPSDRTSGLSGADARGADIAGAWRAGAARQWQEAAGAGAGGGGEE
ncbi:MAG: hypothetical protein J3K34DRAFT_440770 [Monoraphidium minutum]|nr:MAG: hypothetical protein J3K34DRAFT_440770 [Monoraphidium minutum]